MNETDLQGIVRDKWGLKHFQFFNHSVLCQSFICASENAVFVVFRGTDEPGDWMRNIQAFPSPFLGATVHDGFLDALREQWKYMKPAIVRLLREHRIDVGRELIKHQAGDGAVDVRETIRRKLRGEEAGGRTVWFVGHSLGGACATLAAADWSFGERQVTAGVYTYGQPRVGTDSFETLYSVALGSRHFRFVNDVDIVPRVPFMSMGYNHVGKLRYIDETGEIQTDAGFWLRLVDMLEGAAEDLVELFTSGDLGVDFVEDHSMDKGYLRRLAAAAGVSFDSVDDRV